MTVAELKTKISSLLIQASDTRKPGVENAEAKRDALYKTIRELQGQLKEAETAAKKPAKPATTKKPNPKNAHIVIDHNADGTVNVREHATKKAAKEDAMAVRKKGGLTFVHGVDNAKKFGLDPRVEGSQMHKMLSVESLKKWAKS